MLDLLANIINSSPTFSGITTMGMQIGGRYALSEIPPGAEQIFTRPFFKRLFIFFLAYLAFREVKRAIIATLLFIIVFNYLLDEKSKVYIGDKLGIKKKEVSTERIVTVADLQNAREIIEIYNKNLENQKIKL